MHIGARAIAVSLAVLLVAAWTVPVCCLVIVDQPPKGSSESAGPAHRHHHHSGEFDQRSSHISAHQSCAQNCQTPSGMVSTLAGRLKPPTAQDAAEPVGSHLPAGVFQHVAGSPPSGPADIRPASLGRILSLRI